MDRPRQLVLVRHAESVRNEAKKGSTYFADDEARRHIRGIPDHKIPLTALGIRQAQETGVAIRERYGLFSYIYHSGYQRTEQTTDAILEAYTPQEVERMKIRQNHFIRERDPGYAYDMTTEEAETAFPWLKEYWATFGGFMARPPGGESMADVVNRVYTFLNMLIREREGENVMAVIHGGTLRCFRFLLERWNYEQAMTWNNDPKPENCGVTTYEYDAQLGRLVLQQYNEVFWNREGEADN